MRKGFACLSAKNRPSRRCGAESSPTISWSVTLMTSCGSRPLPARAQHQERSLSPENIVQVDGAIARIANNWSATRMTDHSSGPLPAKARYLWQGVNCPR